MANKIKQSLTGISRRGISAQTLMKNSIYWESSHERRALKNQRRDHTSKRYIVRWKKNKTVVINSAATGAALKSSKRKTTELPALKVKVYKIRLISVNYSTSHTKTYNPSVQTIYTLYGP